MHRRASQSRKDAGQGIHNKIKVFKRVAYRYRDDALFLRNLRAAFPGVKRRTCFVPYPSAIHFRISPVM